MRRIAERALGFCTIRVQLWGVACVFLLGDCAWGLGVTYDLIALSGQSAPGAGSAFAGFRGAALAPNGDVAFFAALSGVPTNSDTGIWTRQSGTLQVVARESGQLPGFPSGARFAGFGDPQVGADGQLFFSSRLEGTGITFSNDDSIWTGRPGSLSLVARENSAAAGSVPSLVMKQLGFEPLAAGNHFAFMEGEVNVNLNTRIWSGEPGALRLVAAPGQPVPSIGGDAKFESLIPDGSAFTRNTVNGHGGVAFRGELTGTGITTNNNLGIWRWDNGSLSLVARTDSAAPHTESGVTFSRLHSPVINDAGNVAFLAELDGTAGAVRDDLGIWAGEPGALSLVARAGDPAPGAPDDRSYFDLDNPVLGGNGNIAFVGTLADTTGGNSFEFGLWTGTPGNLRLVALSGDHLPGTDANVVLRDFNSGLSPQDAPATNGRGDVVFQAILASGDPGGPSFLGTGVWAYVNGQVVKLARTGELFDVDPSPGVENLQTIDAVGVVRGSGGQDGRPSGLNDDRVALLSLNFTDGTQGLYAVQIVPEPGTYVLLTIGSLFCAPIARRPSSRKR